MNVILFVPILQGAPVIFTVATEVAPVVVEEVVLHNVPTLIAVETV